MSIVVTIAISIAGLGLLFTFLPTYHIIPYTDDNGIIHIGASWYVTARDFWHNIVQLAPLFSSWIPIDLIGNLASIFFFVFVLPLFFLTLARIALSLLTGGGFK